MKKKTQIRRTVVTRVFGKCGTCGQPNDPRHTCNMRFTPTNAARLKGRMDKRK
jgi:hypothetical protein